MVNYVFSAGPCQFSAYPHHNGSTSKGNLILLDSPLMTYVVTGIHFDDADAGFIQLPIHSPALWLSLTV
jgi:hypothetical protein